MFIKVARFLWVAACVGASCTAVAQSRFSYSMQGAEVTDKQTGLIWRRCSEGQTWSDSTCTGAASTFTHEGARVHAQSQTGWRLPTVKELGSIVDKTSNSPVIDSTAFPATVSSWYWSSSLLGVVDYAWYVSFKDGHANYNRHNSVYVRLVR